ncbi:hypothetical protein HK101_004063 [Irineochytrium annulatum]|nr:hypothetical protein HK101_004063 [Irineochytrium annulatum]
MGRIIPMDADDLLATDPGGVDIDALATSAFPPRSVKPRSESSIAQGVRTMGGVPSEMDPTNLPAPAFRAASADPINNYQPMRHPTLHQSAARAMAAATTASAAALGDSTLAYPSAAPPQAYNAIAPNLMTALDTAAIQASQTLAVLSRDSQLPSTQLNQFNQHQQYRDPASYPTSGGPTPLRPIVPNVTSQLFANTNHSAPVTPLRIMPPMAVVKREQPSPSTDQLQPYQQPTTTQQTFTCPTLTYDPATSTFQAATGPLLAPAPGSSPHAVQALDVVSRALSHLLATHGNPCRRDRLTYALAGQVFALKAPHPFGGPKKEAGFLRFDGHTADDLLEFVVDGMFTRPPAKQKRKKPPKVSGIDDVSEHAMLPPSFAFVVACLNDIVDIFLSDEKDEMDQLVVRGMVRANHLAEEGRICIPKELRGQWVWKYRATVGRPHQPQQQHQQHQQQEPQQRQRRGSQQSPQPNNHNPQGGDYEHFSMPRPAHHHHPYAHAAYHHQQQQHHQQHRQSHSPQRQHYYQSQSADRSQQEHQHQHSQSPQRHQLQSHPESAPCNPLVQLVGRAGQAGKRRGVMPESIGSAGAISGGIAAGGSGGVVAVAAGGEGGRTGRWRWEERGGVAV